MSLLISLGRNLALNYGLAGAAQALTERERDVLREVLRGSSPSDIADAVALSVHTTNG